MQRTHELKSRMRQSRTSGSVGAPGGRLPGATRPCLPPIDRVGANLFFQLISRRYERGPMILTSNQGFGSWGDVFGIA